MYKSILSCLTVLALLGFFQVMPAHAAAGDTEAEVSLLCGGTYYEQEIVYGQPMTVRAAVRNSADRVKNIILYTALCDAKGIVTGLRQAAAAVQPGQSEVLTAGMTAQNGESIRVMVWDQDTQEPLFEEVKLSSVRRDLFGDTLDDAAAVDFGKLVKGRINDAGDVDFIKFIPERTAEYLIGVTSNQPVNETLFGPDQAKLADGIHAGADSFIKARLESGNSYYLKIDGPAAEYTVSMTAETVSADAAAAYGGYAVITSAELTGQTGLTGVLSAADGSGTYTAAASRQGAQHVFRFNGVNAADRYVFCMKNAGGELLSAQTFSVHRQPVQYVLGARDELAVPVSAKCDGALSRLCCSVLYAADSLELADACDSTEAAELGTGVISNGNVNILYIDNGTAAFKTTSGLADTQLCINTVKLRAKTDAETQVEAVICIPE